MVLSVCVVFLTCCAVVCCAVRCCRSAEGQWMMGEALLVTPVSACSSSSIHAAAAAAATARQNQEQHSWATVHSSLPSVSLP